MQWSILLGVEGLDGILVSGRACRYLRDLDLPDGGHRNSTTSHFHCRTGAFVGENRMCFQLRKIKVIVSVRRMKRRRTVNKPVFFGIARSLLGGGGLPGP